MSDKKQCSKCNMLKTLDLFTKDKSKKCGYRPSCKECTYQDNLNYRHTKKGLVSSIFQHQKHSSKKRKNIPPTYSQDDLKEWLFSQPLFHILYDNWKRLDYQKEYTPSVDRLNDYVGYSISNIQLMTWGENKTKSHNDVKNGKNNKYNRAVVQIDKNSHNIIREYYSISEASRMTDIKISAISGVCKNKKHYLSAGGFLWEFK